MGRRVGNKRNGVTGLNYFEDPAVLCDPLPGMLEILEAVAKWESKWWNQGVVVQTLDQSFKTVVYCPVDGRRWLGFDFVCVWEVYYDSELCRTVWIEGDNTDVFFGRVGIAVSWEEMVECPGCAVSLWNPSSYGGVRQFFGRKVCPCQMGDPPL